MKHLAFILSLFCILLLAGCRTTNSVQKRKMMTEVTQNSLEQAVIQMYTDSIRQRMVLAIESIHVELPTSSFVEESVSRSRKPMPSIRLKAYGIAFRSEQKKSANKQTVTELKETVTSLSQKAKNRDTQKTKPNKVFLWISVCITLFLIVCIAYRISRK